MLFAGWEAHIEKICALSLRKGPWPLASLLMQNLRHSFFQYGPPCQQLTYISSEVMVQNKNT